MRNHCRLYKYILFFLLFISQNCFGQDLLFDGEDAFEPDSLYAVRNAVKIDPLRVVFGVYSLQYERILKNGFSLEAEAGITRRNYTAGWFDYSLDDFGKNVEIRTGYAFALSGRKYFEPSEELKGSYLSLGLSLREYKTNFKVIDNNGSLTGYSFLEGRNIFSTSVIYGYQALAMGSNVFADFYSGVSWRYKNLHILKTSSIHSPEAYFISDEIKHTVGFEIGVKLGFGF